MNYRILAGALTFVAFVTLTLRAAAQPAVPADFEPRFFVYLPEVAGKIEPVVTPTPQPPTLPLPFDPAAMHEGEGTYYSADGSGNCSFDPSPSDLLVAALNTTDYHGSLMCGAFIEVSGPSGTVTVRVVDRCPECAVGDVDMSPQAFERIAPLVAGRIAIRWRLLSPAISGNISYKFKEGSNQWWTAVQIRNHRNPIYSVEYRTGAGAWQPMVRQSYNYFLAETGLGAGPATLRVTDIYGNTIVDTGLNWSAGALLPGSAQFP
jgi:expansin (peptidoglycan-binding protein)